MGGLWCIGKKGIIIGIHTNLNRCKGLQMIASIFNRQFVVITFCLLVLSLSAITVVNAQNRVAHLREWEGRYPIDNATKPSKNFFKLPDIQLHLIWLLGATNYKRLLSDFEKNTPIRFIDGFLVMSGSASKSDAEGYTESALVVILLKDPLGYGMICVGTSKKLGEKLASEAEWNCTRGDYLRGSEEELPIKIRAEIDPDASRIFYGESDSKTLPSHLIRRFENIEHFAIAKVKPDYPETARTMAICGKVRVLVEISEKGDILKAKAVSGHDMLREAALKAARQWKFTPPTKENTSTKMRGVIDIFFILE